MLDFNYPLAGLRGAEYNPRKIEDADIAVLGESLRQLGVVKPIIVRNDLIIAGHQRTKALRRLGVTHGPVYQLAADTTTYDETRFNQLHNGTDMDAGDEAVTIDGGLPDLGYCTVEYSRIKGNFRGKLANVRKEIADLITKYGPWGGVVATQTGRVIHCAQYALAAFLTRTPLTVYVIADDREAEYRAFLDRQYGKFSYEHLAKDTWIQSFAQLFRLRGEVGKDIKNIKSTLYEKHVMPYMATHKTSRVLDFGAGQGDYAKRLRKGGFAIRDLEFFRRVPGKQALDIGAVNRMIDGALEGMRYDVVVCDCVLNSVDSLEAEIAVVRMLNAFCQPAGRIFFAGRSQDGVQARGKATLAGNYRRTVDFLDDDGFSGLYRKGSWFYQKYHSREQIEALAARCALRIDKIVFSGDSFLVEATKTGELAWADVASAIDFEFNLPYSKTKRYGRQGDARAAFATFYEGAA